MIEKTNLTKKRSNGNTELTEQELSHVVGGTTSPTTLGPYGPSSVQPAKATVMGTGTDSSNPGFTSDQFTIGSSGLG
jgi:bacteriocin-like protein